jgi:hypothetical protein
MILKHNGHDELFRDDSCSACALVLEAILWGVASKRDEVKAEVFVKSHKEGV